MFDRLNAFSGFVQKKEENDKEMTKRYGGVKTYKDIVIVDTLGFVSVKDSLFGYDERYQIMMNVPFAENEDAKFDLDAGFLNQNGILIMIQIIVDH